MATVIHVTLVQRNVCGKGEVTGKLDVNASHDRKKTSKVSEGVI
jgi:hypothetical protein